MRIDIITIFPKMFAPVLNESIIKRAQAKAKVKIFLHNLRDYSSDKQRKVDDRPFGGGSGMVMRPEPIFNAVDDIKAKIKSPGSKTKVILLSPQGERLTQRLTKRLTKEKSLIIICGHYEGIDERVRECLVDQDISIGDYVLTGGELPAMVLIDCIIRLIPGVLGDKKSLKFESFEASLLEYPQYTRPANYRGLKVPATLLSGNHQKIKNFRQKEAVRVTKLLRPDLFRKYKSKGKNI